MTHLEETAPDHNHLRAGANGERWFRSLGANQVTVMPLIDRASAQDAAIAQALRRSRLLYLLGGFPGYLAETLAGSASWAALREAYAEGAVIAGSSAGAMVLCQYYFDPARQQIAPGPGTPPQCLRPAAPQHLWQGVGNATDSRAARGCPGWH